MAKLKVEYANHISKYTLTFRNKEFDFSMIPDETGSTGDKPCFSVQINKEFPDMTEDILNNEIEIDMIDCSDGEEVFEILERLEDYE